MLKNISEKNLHVFWIHYFYHSYLNEITYMYNYMHHNTESEKYDI